MEWSKVEEARGLKLNIRSQKSEGRNQEKERLRFKVWSIKDKGIKRKRFWRLKELKIGEREVRKRW